MKQILIIFYLVSIVVSTISAKPSYTKTCTILNVTDLYTNEVETKYVGQARFNLTLVYSDGEATGNRDDTIIIVPAKGKSIELYMGTARGYVTVFFPKEKKKHYKDPFAYGILPNGNLVMISPLAKLEYQCN